MLGSPAFATNVSGDVVIGGNDEPVTDWFNVRPRPPQGAHSAVVTGLVD